MSRITETPYFDHEWTAEAIVVVTCITLSLHNCLELLLTILTTFREWRSLYFVSLMVASVGIIPYCVGFLLEYFQLLAFWASMLFSSMGWIMLITGQAFVLYSRLGLIVQNERILRGVKWMIISNAVVFHGMTTAIQYGKAYGGEKAEFVEALFYVEKIQMTGFCVQEFIISGIYMWKTAQFLQLISRQGTRRVMWELFAINAIIILMDIGLLTLEYRGLRTLERAFKSVIYSIKLKLEFAVLGKLISLVRTSTRSMSSAPVYNDSFAAPGWTNSQPRQVQNDGVPDWVTKLETGAALPVVRTRPKRAKVTCQK